MSGESRAGAIDHYIFRETLQITKELLQNLHCWVYSIRWIAVSHWHRHSAPKNRSEGAN